MLGGVTTGALVVFLVSVVTVPSACGYVLCTVSERVPSGLTLRWICVVPKVSGTGVVTVDCVVVVVEVCARAIAEATVNGTASKRVGIFMTGSSPLGGTVERAPKPQVPFQPEPPAARKSYEPHHCST
jgi:hypothetical protein